MDKLDFILERLQLLEQRMKVLEGTKVTDQNATILALQEMSTTIGILTAQLLPILHERQQIKAAIKEAAIEQMFDIVAKTQKYPM